MRVGGNKGINVGWLVRDCSAETKTQPELSNIWTLVWSVCRKPIPLQKKERCETGRYLL